MTFRTSPDPAETGWPRGVPYIIGNEGCERFSFYGMKAILQVYLAGLYLREAGLAPAAAENSANATIHFFVAAVYGLGIVGAVIGDRWLGKYGTILSLSILYCAGHAALAVFEGSIGGVYLGLGLIAVGSGGIKPCVSAHVGDQFGAANWNRLGRAFQAFYFAINLGSTFAMLLIPWTRVTFGWSVAFGIPGVLMAVATVVFWFGRNVFVHVPPNPGGRLGLLDALCSTLLFAAAAVLLIPLPSVARLVASSALLLAGLSLFSLRQRHKADDGFLAVMLYTLAAWVRRRRPSKQPSSPARSLGPLGHRVFAPAIERFGAEATEGPVAVLRVLSVFGLVAFFWALFDQHATSWIEQAKTMQRGIVIGGLGWSTEILPSQIQAANPILVMVLIPFVSFVLYPTLERLGIRMTALRRMSLGMFITSLSFVVVALLQQRLDAGQPVHILWQLLPYLILTLAEVMISVTGLEFAYTQAPRRMKSTLMGFWLLTVALGNTLTGLLFHNLGEHVAPAEFFWLFAALMAGAAVLFSLRATFYRYQDYPQ